MQKVKAIKKIEVIQVHELKGLLENLSKRMVYLRSWRNFVKLEIQDLASLEENSAIKDNVKVYTSTLTFKLKEEQPLLELRGIAFRLTTVDGEQFLLGDTYLPYVSISEQEKLPDNLKTSYKKVLKASRTSRTGVLRLIM